MDIKDYAGILIAVLTGLGLPKLYETFFGHLTKKKEFESSNEKVLQELRLKMSQIEASVEMLLIVIQDEFEGNQSIQNAIQRVQQHLHGEKKSNGTSIK